MTIDRRVVAEGVRVLRSTLPGPGGDLLTGLQRVTEATRAVVRVDGAGLTLTHEHGPPRWVAVSDAAMELLEQVQQGFDEGPCRTADNEDRIVAVEDLRAARAWDRVAAVVDHLHMRGVLSMPVRLAGLPVGTLNVWTSDPRAWSVEEIEAVSAFAIVTAELIRSGGELAARELEVAQLRKALTSRVWIEQAKGVLVASQGVTPEAAFQQLRKRARASPRSWPTSRRRSSGRPSASGSPALPSTTPGCERPRRVPSRRRRRCTRPRPDWLDAPRPWAGRRTTPTPGSVPPTSATEPLRMGMDDSAPRLSLVIGAAKSGPLSQGLPTR